MDGVLDWQFGGCWGVFSVVAAVVVVSVVLSVALAVVVVVGGRVGVG